MLLFENCDKMFTFVKKYGIYDCGTEGYGDDGYNEERRSS